MLKLRDFPQSLMPHLAAIAALVLLAQADGARASVLTGGTFNRPIFTPERDFVIEAPQDDSEIQDDSLPLTIRVFDAAEKSCGLNLDDVHGELAQMLAPASALWQTLDLLFPGSLATVKAKGITLLIDDFSEFAGNNPEYASYFIHDSGPDGDGPVIGLDCSSSVARSYWLASLAHEMTHAILDGRGDESWWEEALAQQMEREIGGIQPDLSAGNLAAAGELPPLLDPRRPLPSHEEYGITYLFAKYIRQEFGGWSALQAITMPEASEAESGSGSGDFLSRLSSQGRSRIHAETGQGLGADKFTRDGLLRYFYVALTMNDPIYPEYSIVDWQGLSAMPSEPAQETLEPGQVAVFTDISQLSRVNPALESYRILVDAQGSFRILPQAPRSGIAAVPAGFKPVRDYALVLNLTQAKQLLLSGQ